MALLSHNSESVGDESLEKWELINSGGFGDVYRARHKEWGFDVAVKLLRDGVGFHSIPVIPEEKALCEEANHMAKASCEFVLRVYGIYVRNPTYGGPAIQKGIVMEFMSRGSVMDLTKALSGPPPWPLTLRLAHQVALGMNFLHSKNLIHHDLKPSNVLLTEELNAKLADFGLSRVSTSALTSKREMTGYIGGTYKYMPPEAFELSYEPVRAFDTYSYGILLWSLVTGKEPYPMATSSLVALRIPLGDRPPCEEINHMEVEGLKELVDLMKKCWDGNPSKRPLFKDCLKDTEDIFLKHKRKIHAAVNEVLAILDSRLQPTSNHQSNTSAPFISPPQTPEKSASHYSVAHVEHYSAPARTDTESSSTQGLVSVSTKVMTITEKAKFVDANRAVLVQDVSEVMAIVDELGNIVHNETYSVIKAKPTSQEQMRTLFQNTFRPGGESVKAAFYDILKRHQPKLVERLGG